jgi:hypothetical protein
MVIEHVFEFKRTGRLWATGRTVATCGRMNVEARRARRFPCGCRPAQQRSRRPGTDRRVAAPSDHLHRCADPCPRRTRRRILPYREGGEQASHGPVHGPAVPRTVRLGSIAATSLRTAAWSGDSPRTHRHDSRFSRISRRRARIPTVRNQAPPIPDTKPVTIGNHRSCVNPKVTAYAPTTRATVKNAKGGPICPTVGTGGTSSDSGIAPLRRRRLRGDGGSESK